MPEALKTDGTDMCWW